MAYSPILFGNQNGLDDIEYLYQNMKHVLTYSWQNRSFCWHIITALIHIPESSKMRQGSGILGSNAPFAAMVFLAND